MPLPALAKSPQSRSILASARGIAPSRQCTAPKVTVGCVGRTSAGTAAVDLNPGGTGRSEQLKFLENSGKRNLLTILLFSILAFAVMGYHPGLEDDGVYLTAVKRDLNPALYPHDADFFRIQLQATLFDNLVAGFIRLTHLPLAITELLFQFISIFLIVLACWCIARLLFHDRGAQWAGVALTASMLTLPVAGTALYLADQHLHPRTIATALVLLAVSRILAGHRGQAVPLMLVAFVLHPIMAAFGISFCLLLTTALLGPVPLWLRSFRGSAVAAVPLGWIFESPTPAWHRALETRGYYFLSRWTWYEWLGALAPLFLFCLLWRLAHKRSNALLARFALAVFAYGVFQQAVAILVLESPALVRLTPLQPMRFLHLIYFFLTLIGGCLLGKFLLRDVPWRWALFLILINGGMFAAQRVEFSSSPHLELPWVHSNNPWLQSFAWIRENTPANAYFAMDPHYLAAPGEDYHSFRALAERSQLADLEKDPSVVTQVPELGPAWQKQVDATAAWNHFNLADFERLRRDFGVDWVIVPFPQPAGLECKWHEQNIAICEIPSNPLTTFVPARRTISEFPSEVEP